MKVISLDVESTGLDGFHGAKPFYVVSSDEHNGSIRTLFWEWPVDPLTRNPQIPKEDIQEIQARIDRADTVVGHNFKFDQGMLNAIGIHVPWEKVHDTLIASHLLASNRPHDLTSLALQYLYTDIEKYEKRIEKIVQECRRYCRSHLPKWRIAKEGLPEMPSAREKTWKYDMWLPLALANHLEYAADDSYRTCLQNYANADGEITLALWRVFEPLLKQMDLWEIYQDSMRLPPIIYGMQQRGITYSLPRLKKLRQAAEGIIYESERVCACVASHYGMDFVLGKGISHALREMIFDRMKLPVVETTDKGEPSANKDAIRTWLTQLDRGTLPYLFIEALSRQRKALKDIEAIDQYERFGVPLTDSNKGDEWRVLHPSINQTGTATTRFSCQYPNGQNVGKTGAEGSQEFSLRYALGPAPDREWWAFDYENLELRIPAYLSGQRELINLFEKSDEPPFYGSEHLLNFSVVYPDIWEDAVRKVGIDKAGPWIKKTYKDTYYQWVKNGDFSIQYQAGDATADRAFRRPGSKRTLVKRFSQKEALNQEIMSFADKNEYVETVPDKTVNPRRGYPLLCKRTDRGSVLNTIPLSYVVQGTAGIVARKAMVRVHAQLQEWNRQGFDGHLILQVHDELDCDWPKGETPEENLTKARRVKELMEMSGNDIGIPLKVSITYHPDNWATGVPIT